MTNSDSGRLGERLKADTKTLHTAVERSGIMARLLRGEIQAGAYCILLRNLYEIYAELEAALDAHAQHPGLAPIRLPQLARKAALEHDLSTLHGGDWAALTLHTTTDEYLQRLKSVAAESPQLLAAHAYVRYLGDLSGGQILRRIVAQALNLQPGHGTRFYEFAEPGASALAERFRAGLAAIPAGHEEIDALVGEARLGFSLHARLFEQMALPGPMHATDEGSAGSGQ
jgi:heme oxygenase